MIALMRGPAAIVLAALLGLGSIPDATAQPRERCAAERAAAEARYLEGRFADAARLLEACIDQQPLYVEEAVRVYRLLALIRLNQGAPRRAEAVLDTLLALAPAYEADEVQDPPSYVALVEVVRARRAAAARPPPEAVAAPPLLPPQDAAEPADEVVLMPEAPPPVRGVKRWLLATGGAVVVFVAALLAVGGTEGGPR